MTLKKTAVALGLAVLVGIGSATLLLNSAHTPCEQRAPLTVMATLAAFVLAFCVRQFAVPVTRAQKTLLFASLLIAALCLFANACFVLQYRAICNAPLPTIDTPLVP